MSLRPGLGPAPAVVAGLVNYDSCGQLLSELKRAALRVVGPYGLGSSSRVSERGRGAAEAVPGAAAPDGPVSAPRPPEHSGTNVAETGVDEPDLVKTDGRRIVTVTDGMLQVVDAASRRVTGVLPIPPRGPGRQWVGQSAQVLLNGDRALVVLPGVPYVGPVPNPGPASEIPTVAGSSAPRVPWVAGSQVLLVDLAGRPRLLGQLTVDGQYVDARQVGGTVRLVARSGPRLRFRYPGVVDYQGGGQPDSAATAANRKVIQRSTLGDWLPRYQVEWAGRSEQGTVPCERVSHPVAYTGGSLLTVHTLDLTAPADRVLNGIDPVSVVADGDTVYGTQASLYVATDLSWPGALRGGQQRTALHRFDITQPGPPRYAASGTVPGDLLGQYALSEYDGYLRVATTIQVGAVPPCCDRTPRTESAVHVLAETGGALTEVGRVAGLGTGERIYAVRFVGPVGYVVTFRQMDPLYTLDLRDPRRPRVVGELKITGYSAYLHPAGEGLLIGVGQEATTQGQRLGTQVSLFDVSDPANPTRLDRYQLPDGYSEVESDPHAFLYWPATETVAVPVIMQSLTPEGANGGMLVLSLRQRTLDALGVVRHPTSEQVRRTLVAGDTLWTVSAAGLQANDLRTLVEQGWVPFR